MNMQSKREYPRTIPDPRKSFYLAPTLPGYTCTPTLHKVQAQAVDARTDSYRKRKRAELHIA
jgi:hypothetical protein